MAWASLTIVTDADLGMREPQTTSGKWGTITWPNQRAEAKRQLKVWMERDFSHIRDVADKIRDTYGADKVWGYTDGTFSDVSTDATTIAEDDVDLSDVFVDPSTDRLYIGSGGSFDGLTIRMLSHLNVEAATLTVKYSGGTGWRPLVVVDGIAVSGATFAGSGRITWTQPADWQRRTLNNSAESYYWIELSVSAVLTAGTSIGQILMIKPPDGLRNVALLLALGYISLNLAAQAPSTDYWTYKARNQFKTGFLDEAEREYALMRDKGGIPIDLNDDGKIDVHETKIVNPLRIGRA